MNKFLIKTKRLGLRFIRKEDTHYLEILNKDPKVTEFFPNGVLNDKDINRYVNHCLYTCEKKNIPCFVIFKLETDLFVGEAYFDQLESGEVKVGYLFHKKYWHRGYATEVLKALLNWAKKHIDTDYIIAYADKDNEASIHVLEKCGMEFYKDGYYMDMESKFYRIKNR